MRTWKQGRIGKITFPDSSFLYMRCLRYPLAQFYQKVNTTTQSLEHLLFEVMIEKSTLKYIEIIGQEKLRNKDLVKKTRYKDELETENQYDEKKKMHIERIGKEEVLNINQIQVMYRQKRN